MEDFLSHQDDMVLSRRQAPLLVLSVDFLPSQRTGRKGLGVLSVCGLNFGVKLCQVPFGLLQFAAALYPHPSLSHSMSSKAEPVPCLFFLAPPLLCILLAVPCSGMAALFVIPLPIPSTQLLFLNTQNMSVPTRDRMNKVCVCSPSAVT